MRLVRWECNATPWVSWCLFLGIVVLSQHADAQFTANFQTNIINTSTFIPNDIVGSNTYADVVIVRNKATLGGWLGLINSEVGSSNNTAVVTDTGSVWMSDYSDPIGFYIGYSVAFNT